jgi:hypothetical protein
MLSSPVGVIASVLTFLPLAPTLGHGIRNDAASFAHERNTMGRMLSIISDTIDRRKPLGVFADGGNVPIWFVLHH